MKAALFSALLSLAIAAPAFATTEDQAASEYSKREFSEAGIGHAREAAKLYGELAASASDNNAKAKFLTSQSQSQYFVGNASSDNGTKKDQHWAGYQSASEALRLLGVDDPQRADAGQLKGLPVEQRTMIAEALYHRGANLGMWGQANGVVSSLGRWPELRKYMELIEEIGMASHRDFGAARTLGRGYYKIPRLLGGSMDRAYEYLSNAVNQTKVSGQPFSRNGYNNTFYAEVLNAQGRTDEAIEMLKAFVAASPENVDRNEVPEIRQSQREAADLISAWE